ncbi:MAG TPA: hypothetical protein VLK25_14630 [Allosphingosinicella sp.]|nr:hypothetical protein [Allosphingosinicella sp.]
MSTSQKGCAARLLLAIIVFALGVVAVHFATHALYFEPLCQSVAETRGTTFISYTSGGRSSPAGCSLVGAFVPLSELGWLPKLAPIIDNLLKLALPALLALGMLLMLSRRKASGQRRAARTPPES